MVNIFTDLNARLPQVSDTDEVTLFGKNSVLSNLYKLVKTREGEIPNYRVFGLDVQQFEHYPLNNETGLAIYDYVISKIERFEQRGQIVDEMSTIILDQDNDYVSLEIAVQVISTGEIFFLNVSDILTNQ